MRVVLREDAPDAISLPRFTSAIYLFGCDTCGDMKMLDRDVTPLSWSTVSNTDGYGFIEVRHYCKECK